MTKLPLSMISRSLYAVCMLGFFPSHIINFIGLANLKRSAQLKRFVCLLDYKFTLFSPENLI